MLKFSWLNLVKRQRLFPEGFFITVRFWKFCSILLKGPGNSNYTSITCGVNAGQGQVSVLYFDMLAVLKLRPLLSLSFNWAIQMNGNKVNSIHLYWVIQSLKVKIVPGGLIEFLFKPEREVETAFAHGLTLIFYGQKWNRGCCRCFAVEKLFS